MRNCNALAAQRVAKNPGLSTADAYRLLRDTSTRSGAVGGEGMLVDACAAVLSLIGQGSCSPTTESEHRMADEREQRVARH